MEMKTIKRVTKGNDFNRKAYYEVRGEHSEKTTTTRTFRPYQIGEEYQMGTVVDCKETHAIGAKWTVTIKSVQQDVKTYETYAEAKSAINN
jgi:hypothetical protein